MTLDPWAGNDFLTAGTGVTLTKPDTATGGVTITVSGTAAGVSSIIAGDGISVDQATGDVTVSATGSLVSTVTFDTNDPFGITELAPAPGANQIVVPLSLAITGPGGVVISDWNQDTTTYLTYRDELGQQGGDHQFYLIADFLGAAVWFTGVGGAPTGSALFPFTPDFFQYQVDELVWDTNEPAGRGVFLNTYGVPVTIAIEDAGTGYVVNDTVINGTFRATVATVNGGGGVTSLTITDSGSDYASHYPGHGAPPTGTPLALTNTAPQSGIGTGLTFSVVEVRPLVAGRPLTGTVGVAGTGYAPGDTVTDTGSGTIVITIDTVGGGGAVTGYTITTPGTEYDYRRATNYTTVKLTGAGDDAFQFRPATLEGGTVSVSLIYAVAGA